MNVKSEFVVIDHKALKAGIHQDLRFIIPSSKMWASFAVRKGVPLTPGTRVLAMQTHLHSKEEALFVGTIPKGEYGAGELSQFDRGQCIILKYSPAHISIQFQGKKVKGIYHFISIGNIKEKSYKEKAYMLFKSKE